MISRPRKCDVERLIGAIEKATVLDSVADPLAGVAARLLRGRRLKSALSGTVLGHPLHPALVLVPAGSWLAASYLDVTGGTTGRRAARHLIALGNIAALPAALSGASDWVDTTGAERRIGLVHALLNDTALLLYFGSGRARRSGNHGRGVALALAGATAVSAAGWLGGHLAYARGVGVDTTAFQVLPANWVDVAADGDARSEKPLLTYAAGVPIILLSYQGKVVAYANRCTHRGGPLHECGVAGGELRCPWHGSRFDVADGSVRTGPATRPLQRLEVRTIDTRVQVRRWAEPGSLRSNPVT